MTQRDRCRAPVWLTRLVTAAAAREAVEPDELLSEVVEALLRAPRGLARDGNRFPDGPFAARRARWALSDVLRRRRRQRNREIATDPVALTEPLASTDELPDVRLERLRTQRAVRRTLAGLSDGWVDLAALRLIDGLTEREIASRLGLSPAAVHRRWGMIRDKLFRSAQQETG